MTTFKPSPFFKSVISVFFGSLFLFKIEAQPVSNFTGSNSACLKQSLRLINNSTSATNYIWDFCNNDLQDSNPSITTVTTLPTTGTFYYSSLKLIHYQGGFVGFATDVNGVKLIRLNFGMDLNSTPTIDNLGDLGLTSPGPLDAVYENGIWYLFILNVFGNTVTRITMGNGILSAPSLSENMGNIGNLSTPVGIKVVASGNSHLLFVSNLGNQTISVIDFQNSFTSTSTSFSSLSNSLIIDPGGIDIISWGLNWYGMVTSFDGNGHTILLNFGSDLSNTPIASDLGIVTNGREAKIVKEGLNYYGFVRSENSGIYKISFGTDFSAPSTFAQISTNLLYNTSRSLDVIKDSPTWKLFTIESTLGNLIRLDFDGNCTTLVSSDYSLLATPTNIQYLTSGTYSIELTAYDNAGSYDTTSLMVSVSSNYAPQGGNINSNGKCVNNEVKSSFNTQNTITNYLWDFGDNTSSSSSNPTHIYTSTSVYYLILTVTATNGCQNIAYDTIQIFNPPQASFTLPNASPFCSNQNYVYTNTSTYDSGSNPTWQWSVNGTTVASTQDLTYLFSSTATQNVTLTASIPGCSSDSMQTVSTLVDGPLVSFTSPATGCQDNAVSFTNTTSESTTSLLWSFGDGNTSVQSITTNSYSSTGTFPVTLSVGNALGCQNYLTKNISIYSVPQPDFAIEAPPLSCANYPAQFDNNTNALTDSNITSWLWNFGDAANGTSNEKRPAYTFSSAANYTVSLTATSNFGCTNTTQKSITISPSPNAAFNFSPACVNQNTQFTDASTGTVTSYQWNIQNNPFTTRNPQYIFSASGNYPITFTVTASNGCKSQVVKTITVPVPPTVDFSTHAPCTNNATTFQELYPNGSDPTVTWSWNFGQGSGSGSPVSHEFPAAGTYTITLTTTRQSGCVYSASKNISVSTGPTADFTPSVEAGAAPLNVTFNNSSSAASYLWSFGDADNSTSTATSPTFTYTSLGNYKALLTASNSLGCTDTLSAWINVVVPHIDLVMNNFSLLNNTSSNSSEVIITISNAGNIPMTNPEIDIDLGGNATVKENLTGTIRPGASYQQTLSLGIVTQYLKYLCIDVDATDDVDLANNKLCETLTNGDVVQTPYPNPAKGQINFDWIASSSENVRVVIYTITGEAVFEQTFDAVLEGLNQLSIDTSSLSNGLYLIQFNGSKTSKTFKIAVTND